MSGRSAKVWVLSLGVPVLKGGVEPLRILEQGHSQTTLTLGEVNVGPVDPA